MYAHQSDRITKVIQDIFGPGIVETVFITPGRTDSVAREEESILQSLDSQDLSCELLIQFTNGITVSFYPSEYLSFTPINPDDMDVI